MINIPVPQYEYSGDSVLAHERMILCPKCRNVKGSGHNYGIVDTPPIAMQIDDNHRSITREWQAQRCYCENCEHMWDVVTVNNKK